ncbi:MAG: metallophosphoesterase [Nanoarchaeota archaeon]|nr:metallophosphoesterase [Nanoarchaeota archaeon]
MRFLILGDLHGALPKIHFKEFDAVIFPGDFCSFEGRDILFKIPREKWHIPWYNIVGRKKAKEMIKRDVERGRKVLEKLNKLNAPVFIVPGNIDYYGNSAFLKEYYEWKFYRTNFYKNLIKQFPNIKDCHFKQRKFKGITIIGYGLSSSPDYPIYAKRPYTKEQKRRIKLSDLFLKKLQKLFKKAKAPVIFLSHNVPYNTKLDKIINKSSPMNGKHFGSIITRRIIEKYKPLICIAGHMHEHLGKCRIGKTVVVNAGFGPDKNILLEIKGNKIKRLEFHPKP